MASDTVLYEAQGLIGTIILNRPEKLNAFSRQMLADFEAALARAEADSAVRVVIIKGAGRAFSVGYDVSGSDPGPAGIAEDREWLQDAIGKWLRVWDFPKPVIAQVHGYCCGGATMLAVCCDITLVSEECKIRWPALPLGGGLISTMWTWLSGPKKAKEMSFIAGSETSGAGGGVGEGDDPDGAGDCAHAIRSAADQETRDQPRDGRAGLPHGRDVRGGVGRDRALQRGRPRDGKEGARAGSERRYRMAREPGL